MDRGGTRSMLNTNFEKEELEGISNKLLTLQLHFLREGYSFCFVLFFQNKIRPNQENFICENQMSASILDIYYVHNNLKKMIAIVPFVNKNKWRLYVLQHTRCHCSCSSDKFSLL